MTKSAACFQKVISPSKKKLKLLVFSLSKGYWTFCEQYIHVVILLGSSHHHLHHHISRAIKSVNPLTLDNLFASVGAISECLHPAAICK